MTEPLNTSAANVIRPLWIYCQKVLPAVYDDSLTYYEAVCKVVEKLNEVIAAYSLSGDAIQQLQGAVEELQKELEDWKNGGFKDYIKDSVTEWVNTNLEYIYRYTIAQVFFGLNEEGYFVAYIPQSWNEIMFDTGVVYGIDSYGRLILRYNTTGATTAEQTRTNEVLTNG